MNRIITLLAIVLLLTNCKKEEIGFVITGNISEIPDSTLVRLVDLDAEAYIDSSFTINGAFKLKGRVEHPSTCRLQVNGESIVIMVENVDMTFTSTIEDIRLNSKTTGGREQDLQSELYELQKPYDIIYLGAVDSLMNERYLNDDEQHKLIEKLNESQAASHQVYVDFGLENSNSYLGMDIIYKNRKTIPKDTLTKIYEGLEERFKQTKKAQAIKLSLENVGPEVGSTFIDFNVKTLDGEDFKLSDLKGNYIYLSFWNAGCGPCRLENRFFSEYIGDIPNDLSIVSFSIDKNYEDWKRASEKDNISWYNVSDGEGNIGTIKTKYEVQAIPMSFLIDKNGIIIKKLLGFDPDKNIIEELKKYIAEE